MIKIAVRVRKYINRISVLVTVFAVLMTASFYNPASLAASNSLPFNVVCNSLTCWTSSNSEDSFGNSIYFTFVSGSGGYTDIYLPFSFEANSLASFSDDGFGIASGSCTIYVRFSDSSHALSCNLAGVDFVQPSGANLAYTALNSYMPVPVNEVTNYPISFRLVFSDVQLSRGAEFVSGFIHLKTAVSQTYDSLNYYCKVALRVVNDGSLSVVPGYASGSKQDVVGGYDASAGNASQSKLDTSLSESEAKQDSLFTSASDTLSGFALSDISTMPKVVAGLSFVSSVMTSVYDALGGINGAGIVLAVGCSILFVSLSVGAYKFYSAHKD